MLITTQDEFSDYDITAPLGLVRGNTIRDRHIGKDILAGLRTLVGGEITEYTKMLAESREQSIDRDRQLFAKLPDGMPDGMTVDIKGGVWVAVVAGSGEVVRFKPDGTIDQRVNIPAKTITSIAFGGPGSTLRRVNAFHLAGSYCTPYDTPAKRNVSH